MKRFPLWTMKGRLISGVALTCALALLLTTGCARRFKEQEKEIEQQPINCATADGHQVPFSNPQQDELIACNSGDPSCTWDETPTKPTP